MKKILSKVIIIVLSIITTHLYAQKTLANNAYYGGNISVNQTTYKGSWEIDSGVDAGDKINYTTSGNNMTLDIFLGYEKKYDDYFLAFEAGLDITLSNSTENEQDKNWAIEFEQGSELVLSALIGQSLNNKDDIYLRMDFIPYSKYNIKADHLFEGGWEDHNFAGFGVGVGYRHKLSEDTFFRNEVVYEKYDFDQPAKDNAISNEEVSEIGLSFGIIRYF